MASLSREGIPPIRFEEMGFNFEDLELAYQNSDADTDHPSVARNFSYPLSVGNRLHPRIPPTSLEDALDDGSLNDALESAGG